MKKKNIIGTSLMPRLTVYRSNKYMYAQIIDDASGVTLAGVTQKHVDLKGKKQDIAKALGNLIAKRAQEKKVQKVVFDRRKRAYHGVIKAIADGAREGGLKF